MASKRERREAKRRKKQQAGKSRPRSRTPARTTSPPLVPEFFVGCGKLTDAEFEELWDHRLQEDPFSWGLPREGFEGDRCEIGVGFWPVYYEIYGERNGKPVKMVVGTGFGGGGKYYRFVDPDFDVTEYVSSSV